MIAIDAIGAVGASNISSAVAPALNVSGAAAASSTTPADFGALLGDGISKLDAGLQAADQQLRAAAAGKDVPVHDLMISMEQARMQLMFVVEVRNRAIEAYQELMRMQL